MERRHRVEHVLPASNPRFVRKAAESDADVLFLDLEDAVAPSVKVSARQILIDALRTTDFRGKKVFVRPNGLRTKWAAGDYQVVREIGDRIDGVAPPKVVGPEDVRVVNDLLAAIETERGWPLGRLKIEALIELPIAVLQARPIAQTIADVGRGGGLIFGLVDYTAATGGRPEAQEAQFLYPIYAKRQIVEAAQAAGLYAIDGVTVHVKDYERTKRDAIESAKMGFTGKWSVHPEQIRAVLDADKEYPFARRDPVEKPARKGAATLFSLAELDRLAREQRPIIAPEPPPQKKIVARRSSLVLTSVTDRLLRQAFESEADQIIIDITVAWDENTLNTALAPYIGKREKVIAFKVDPSHPEDLSRLLSTGLPVDAILLDNAENPEPIRRFEQTVEAGRALSKRSPIGVQILIKTMSALSQAFYMATASQRVESLMFAIPGHESDFYAKGALLAAAAAAGVDAIDNTTEDPERLREEARHAAIMGFSGKLVRLVREVPIVNEIFSPSREQIERALEIVGLYDKANETGSGAIVYVNKRKQDAQEELVDEATVKVERRILVIAEKAGLFTDEQLERYRRNRVGTEKNVIGIPRPDLTTPDEPYSAQDIQRLVSHLAYETSDVRELAAERLYDLGSAIAQEILEAWRKNEQLQRLVFGPPVVGVAVEPERFSAIRAAWGSPPLAQMPPDQDVEEFEIHVRHAHLDILRPKRLSADKESVLETFLRKHGEGIQQVELWTSDVDEATAVFKAQHDTDLKLVYSTPRQGANGTRVNFLLFPLRNGRKALVELVQMAPGVRFEAAPRRMTDTDIRVFAKYSGDRNPFHLDEGYASASRYGARVAHGFLTMGLVLASVERLVPGYAVESVEISKFTNPVKVGDRVVPHMEVVELFSGGVRLKLGAANQNGQSVLEGTATVRPHVVAKATPRGTAEQPYALQRWAEAWAKDVRAFPVRTAPPLQIGDQASFSGDLPESHELKITKETVNAARAIFGEASCISELVALGAMAHTSAMLAPGYILVGAKVERFAEPILVGDHLISSATVSHVGTTRTGRTLIKIRIKVSNQYGKPVVISEVTKLRADETASR